MDTECRSCSEIQVFIVLKVQFNSIVLQKCHVYVGNIISQALSIEHESLSAFDSNSNSPFLLN